MTKATLVKTMVETKEDTKRLYRLVGTEIAVNPFGFGDTDPEETTEYFIASRVHAQDHGDWETLLFPADAEGNITSYLEIWGVRGWEPIEDTVNMFIDKRNSLHEARLHSDEDLLD